MKPVQKLLSAFSASTVLFASLAAALALWSFISLKSWQEDSRTLSDDTGRALASSNALQFSAPLMSGDRLSMQAALKELASLPIVLKAQIHDVENRLLAQAQQTNTSKLQPRVFSAPITVQDTIAGYLTIELRDDITPMARDHQVRWLTLTLLLFILTTGIALTRSRNTASGQTHPTTDDSTDDYSLTSAPTETTEAQSEEWDEGEQLQLLIHCKNFSALQQQLDHNSYQLLLEKFELWLQKLGQLYHFDIDDMQGDIVTLNFEPHTDQDAQRFHCLCAVQLIFTFSRSCEQRWLAGVAPQFSALLKEAGGNFSEQRNASQQVQQVPAEVSMLSETLSENANDDERLECHLNDSNIAFISGLASRYTDLLAGQTQQLNNAIN